MGNWPTQLHQSPVGQHISRLIQTANHKERGIKWSYASICKHASTAFYFASTSSDHICLASSEPCRNSNPFSVSHVVFVICFDSYKNGIRSLPHIMVEVACMVFLKTILSTIIICIQGSEFTFSFYHLRCSYKWEQL